MDQRDYAKVENEDGSWRIVYWPMCSVPGCEARVCLGVPDSDRCFPHSGITLEQLEEFRRPFGPEDGVPA